MGRVASVYLTDYAQELKRVGEVVFRRRYSAPVLIVTGRAAELVGGPDRPSREVTMLSKPGGGDVKSLALMHRVFPIVKAPFSPRGPVPAGRFLSSSCSSRSSACISWPSGSPWLRPARAGFPNMAQADPAMLRAF